MAGRGLSLLEKLRQQQAERKAELSSSDQISSSGSGSSTPSSGMGRAALIAKLKPAHSLSTPPTSVTGSSSSPGSAGAGRAALIAKVMQAPVPVPGLTQQMKALSVDESIVSSEVISEESGPVIKRGETGVVVDMTANFIDIKFAEGTGIYQYLVKFSPDIDSRNLRSNLLNQHRDKLGEAKVFDGSLLYLPKQMPQNSVQWPSTHPADESKVMVTITFKKKQKMSENIPFFNNLINRVMRKLELVRIGRQNYLPNSAHVIENYKLELWPGYVTAINEFEGGVKLNIDATHRVIRTNTVHNLMGEIASKNGSNFKNAILNELIGTSVLTRYNNKSYRIADIDWDMSPMSTFDKGGEKMTFAAYYKQHWNLTIKDMKQPLLVYMDKKKNTEGQTVEEKILLIPEICYLAGLTENMRSDFRMMREMAKITQVGPPQRCSTIMKFIHEINRNEECKKIFSDWGLELQTETTSLKGRVLPQEEIIFGEGRSVKAGDKADWSNTAVRSPVLYTPNLSNWVILFSGRDERSAKDFKEMMEKVTHSMKFLVKPPQMILLRDDRTESYIREMSNVMKSNELEMIVTIVPTNRNDRYSAIKKLCCKERPIASQVIVGKTIGDARKLKSVTEKIALQMNCKLGGSLWMVKNPFQNTMICGIDVYHGGVGSGPKGSVAAFVASMDKELSKWYSISCCQSPRQELIDLLRGCLDESLKAYSQRNGRYPDKIIIYRDGVGDGQLETVKNFEVKQFIDCFKTLDSKYDPGLTVIIVQKRINTKLMIKMRGSVDNPPPGTIVDSDVTRKSYYDFFLVPQTARQGTVTPTHYIVLHDSSDTKVDHIQRITYKLCHLYYNWPGTVKVPAPVQYAHKLAYLVGQSIQANPHPSLAYRLFYL